MGVDGQFDGQLAATCENSSLYVPKNEYDLKKVMGKIKISNLKEPLRRVFK